MLDVREINPQYITNATGKRTAVVVPLDAFEGLLEDLEDLAAVAERREEPSISHEQLTAELKTDGIV